MAASFSDMNMIDVTPDLRMLVLDNPGQAYLVRHGEHVVLVDTGTAGQAEAIAEALESWGSSRDALTHVLLTHWHPDHVGSAGALGGWPNAKIWAHRADAPIIRGDQPGGFPVLTHTEEAFYAQAVGHVPDAAPARVDRELEDDEILDEIGVRVIATPGHTEGSIAFSFPDEKILFTGDVATLQQGRVVLGPFDVDRDAARRSFRRLADLDVETVCFGHGEPLTGEDVTKLAEATHAETVPDPLG
jgi:glyoxylase-like metal-dependent hydrolase (beta-lactamase superfamily II)